MQDNEEFPRLYFRKWPCQNASLDEPTEVWADRAGPLGQMSDLLDYLNSVEKTSLNLMWADLGCGKTHAMGFIRHLCLTKYENIYPIYTLVPNRVTSFVDQYKNIISGFDFDDIAKMTRAIIADKGEDFLVNRVLGGSMDLHGAVKSISLGSSHTQEIAKRWLGGSTVISKADLSVIGATKVVKTNDEALSVLQGLSRIVIHSRSKRRLLIMVDEYQRLHETSDKISKDVGVGLHTLYNAVPTRLSILLSFAFRQKRNVEVILSRELKSRTDTRSIELPEMERAEVRPFVEELFDAYRTAKRPPTRLYPLRPECLDAVINDISTRRRLGQKLVLCPREVISRVDLLLDVSRRKASEGDDPIIAGDDAASIL